ncbi:MAG: hypothetical protein HLUCCX14_09525 [Marinobacter excellens HL-55]|uniref:Uncharacterized protein n=1 Tax=Marinobacter excellens HL-55 TaxID=1305731 RepID=A0A0P7YE25_9GAMM|nr:MAG: hypothetical protein HLUCCX14_09525 [Marinobacter excellens HL-55]
MRLLDAIAGCTALFLCHLAENEQKQGDSKAVEGSVRLIPVVTGTGFHQ